MTPGDTGLMQDANLEEIRLIERAMKGDAQAFGELYVLHLDAIFRYILIRIGTIEDAEDLTEQTFLKAWEALPRYRQIGKPFISWLYRIAHNVVIDFHRKNSQLLKLNEGLLQQRKEEYQTSESLEIRENEELSILSEAIRKLSGEQQQVIILRFFEGMSHRQVAQVIGKNEGTCRMIQYRALLALQQIIGNDEKHTYGSK